MTKVLSTHVHVHHPEHATEVFPAGTAYEALPEWACEQIGDHCFIDASAKAQRPAPSATDGDGPPPKTGKGSGKAAWKAYADRLGVAVDSNASRDDIIAAVDAAEADNS